MTEEIKAIIEKNLPSQVGDILKKTLEQGKQDAKDLETARQANKDACARISTLELNLNEYKKFDERNSKVEAREIAVTEKERNQKVFEAELKLAEAEKRITDNTNFVGMVFKSPIFRKTVSGASGGNYDSQGRWIMTFDNNKTEEKKID